MAAAVVQDPDLAILLPDNYERTPGDLCADE